jgi:SulP family sulfate permease
MQRITPNRLSFANFRGDLFGGATAAIVALPLAIAFGVASGAGAGAGLIGAICVGFFAALFGGTAIQISGPTGPMTIVFATVFTQFAGRPGQAFTVVILAGAFQMLFGYLKLGRFINLLPYPVISGFMTGIGCILIIMQLEPLFGHPIPQNVINALTLLPDHLAHGNVHAIVVGAVAFGICTLTPKRIARAVPPPIIALVAGVILTSFLKDAPVLGEFASVLPAFGWPVLDFADLNRMLVSAAVLAALGAIDSLLTSLVADNATRTFHNSDKELVGQGIGNIVAGFAGGLPGAGATVRTLSNFKAGGRTPLSGMFHAVALLAIALGLAKAVTYVPLAALAGVLLKVGIDVIDWRFLRLLRRAPRTDLILMIVVLLLTVFVDVITAVGVGVVLASLAFVVETARIQVEAIKPIVDPEHAVFLTPEENTVFRQCGGRVMWLHLSGLISFGAATEMTRRSTGVSGYDVLVVDLLDVPHLDGSAALAMEEIFQRAAAAGQEIIIVGLNFAVARLLAQIGALDEVRETGRFATRREAVSAAHTIVIAAREAAT